MVQCSAHKVTDWDSHLRIRFLGIRADFPKTSTWCDVAHIMVIIVFQFQPLTQVSQFKCVMSANALGPRLREPVYALDSVSST